LSLFFFQAEDGIRDRNVTGVQTCALPISEAEFDAAAEAPTPAPACDIDETPAAPAPDPETPPAPAADDAEAEPDPEPAPAEAARSEERRVGKECRAGRAPHQTKDTRAARQ